MISWIKNIFKDFVMIQKLPDDSFTWNRWRAFNLFKELGIAARYENMKLYQSTIYKYAIGYIKADSLRCRPKQNHYAIMFLKDNVFSWCHFTKKEFKEIIKESKCQKKVANYHLVD